MTKKVLFIVLLLQFIFISVLYAAANAKINKVRLSWPIIPRAVYYQVVILKSEEDTPKNIEVVYNKVFTNGIEIDFSHAKNAKKFYYKVCPLNYEGEAIEKFSKPVSILKGEINTTSPKPTALLNENEDSLLYPSYSWIPMWGARNYEVEVYRKREKNTLIHTLRTTSCSIYEKEGFTYPDNYFWRVRAIGLNDGKPLSDWSDEVHFTVKKDVKIAALGDSITHGGGAISVPPTSPLYRYEAYADIEIKNLGRSGDTTYNMLQRFEKDVLPFKPKILIIMGGVNDIRERVGAWTTITNLAAIRDKCKANGIIPVFVTTTPINPNLTWRAMNKTDIKNVYQHRLRTINDWILKEPYAINVLPLLCNDDDLYLYPWFTTDGIHPDHIAKERIGKAISKYIKKTFPEIVKP